MPASAILSRKSDFSRLGEEQRVSLKKFSIALVILQAVPFFLVGIFVVLAGARLGYFSLQQGLVGVVSLLLAFYLLMPGLSEKVIEGVMALRKARQAKKGV